MNDYPFETLNTPSNRTLVIDAGELASRRHVIYGFLEADVTRALELIHQSPEKISFTSYIVACLARAVAADPSVQAYRKGGRNSKKLVIFRDVDVVVMIEPKANATAFPHIIRKANQKTVQEISEEIHGAKSNPKTSQQDYDKKLTRVFSRLPKYLRMWIYQILRRNPDKLREKQGTVILTSVGMFGRKNQGGWGLTFLPMHTLGVTLGGIQRKPAVVENDEIKARDFLCVTVAFDHDVVDGAPGARFASRFVKTIEDDFTLINQQPKS